MKFLCFVFALLITGLGGTPFAFAQVEEVSPDALEVIDLYEKGIDERLKKEKEERIRERNRNALEKALNRTHKRISRSIFSVSDSIDAFFAGDRFEQEKNGSLIRTGYEGLLVEHHDPRHKISVNARLVLPRTKDRLNFLLQSLDDDNEVEEQNPQRDYRVRARAAAADPEKKQNLFAGLRLRNIQTKEWSVNTDAGIKLVWTPDPFARFRIRRSFFMSKWELRLTENVFWYESAGWSQVAAVELERPFPPKYLLKFGNNGIRKDSIGYWEFTHAVSWSHQISQDRAISYATGVTADEEPAYALTSYFVSMAFRQNVFENWIFLDVVPTGAWPRDENFAFVPSVRVKFEAVLGGL